MASVAVTGWTKYRDVLYLSPYSNDGSCAARYSAVNRALNVPVTLKGVQFLDQLTHCEEDQEAFHPTYCVTIRMLSTSRRSVPRLCGQSDPISISYTFDGNLSREKKINPLNA